MTPLQARVIVARAADRDPELRAALAVLKAEHVALGQEIERMALRATRGDKGSTGGHPPWPHWHEARRLYAETDPRLLPTQRAVIVRLKLMEKRRSSVPSVKYLARRLK